jgi:hypothetical protein
MAEHVIVRRSHSTAPQATASVDIRDDSVATRFLVLSVGIETPLYRELSRIFPELASVTVDVREHIRAPLRADRVGGRWPDAFVVAQVSSSHGFLNAVGICREVLELEGVVVVACKGGNHRAPTVAAEVWGASYTIHSCTTWLGYTDIARVLMTCLRPYPEVFQDHLIQVVADDENNRSEYTVGWDWYGFAGHVSEVCMIRTGTPLKLGALLRGGLCMQVWIDNKTSIMIHINHLVPLELVRDKQDSCHQP